MISSLSLLCQTIASVWKRVWKSHKKYLILSFLSVIILAVISNANIWISREIVDAINIMSWQGVATFTSLLFVTQIAQHSINYIKGMQDRTFNERFTIDSEQSFIDTILQREVVEREDPKFQGKFQFWREAINKYLNTYITSIQLIQVSWTIILNIGLLYNIGWAIVAMVLGSTLVKVRINLKKVNVRINILRKIQEYSRKLGYYNVLLMEPMSQKEVTLYQAAPYLKGQWYERRLMESGMQIQLQRITLTPLYMGQLISSLSVSASICLVAYYILNQKLTIGDYIATTLAMSLAESSLTTLVDNYTRIKENSTIIRQYENEQKQKNTTILTQSKSKSSFQFQREIKIQDLSFTYPNRKESALKNISLKINKGETVVILGNNGSGKSTLIKLLIGLYPAPSGTIFYDGIDQSALDRRQLWNSVSVLFQDYLCYLLKLRENLSMGNLSKLNDDIELLKALCDVGVSIDLFPNGLDTELGHHTDQSVNLSGGQWQRLGLARTILRDGSIVVLDEPTSTLDPNSELELFEDLISRYKEKTLIIVSHRVGIAAKADKIIIFKDGEIAESGSHQELLLKNGIYKDMWVKQRAWYQIEESEAVING